MEQLFKVLEEKLLDILTIIFFSGIGFSIYMLYKRDPIKSRLKGAALGFFISLAFSYPAWLVFGNDKWWALAGISSVLTISGQFLPELIEITFKKYATNKASNYTGDSK